MTFIDGVQSAGHRHDSVIAESQQGLAVKYPEHFCYRAVHVSVALVNLFSRWKTIVVTEE